MRFWLRKVAIFPIRVYKMFISPLLPPSCRYHPTCSVYMMEAIGEWGIGKGIWLGLKRLGRCHPYATTDMFDPVPKKSTNVDNRVEN